jgi:hypothetical protein
MPDTAVAWRADPPRHVQPFVETIRSIARAVYARSAGERGPQHPLSPARAEALGPVD